jgi:hypothetical protein
MRVGLHTLCVLRKVDPDAEVAFRNWLALADHNNGPVHVAAWWRAGKGFSVGLVWE